MEKEDLVVVVLVVLVVAAAEKKTIWPLEERLMTMLVLGLFNARKQKNRLLNCCEFIRPTVLLYVKANTDISRSFPYKR